MIITGISFTPYRYVFKWREWVIKDSFTDSSTSIDDIEQLDILDYLNGSKEMYVAIERYIELLNYDCYLQMEACREYIET